MTAYCDSCGTELSDPPGRFCRACGSQIDAPADDSPKSAGKSRKAPGESTNRWPLLAAAGVLLVAVGIGAVLLLSQAGSTASSSTTSLLSPRDVPPNVAVVIHVPSSLGLVTKSELDRAIDQAAIQAGLKSTPTPGQPKYKETEEAALGELFDEIWIQGQAAEMGITATKKEIATEFAQIKNKDFKTDKEYKAFLKSSHFTEADVLDRVKLQLLSTEIQKQLSKGVKGSKTAQQKAFSNFVNAYQKRWRSRTVCAAEYVDERCSNGPAPKTERSPTTSAAP